MSEWKEYKLGEICEVTSSKRIFYSERKRDQGNYTFCHIEPYRNNKNNRQ